MCLPTVKCPRGRGCLLATRIEFVHVTTSCTVAGISTLFQCTFQISKWQLARTVYWSESGYPLPILSIFAILCLFVHILLLLQGAEPA